MEQILWLLPLGIIVGIFGTLIGAGGGFILVPVMLLAYPEKSPEVITSVSLAVVFFNAFSGSFAYFRMKRIEFKAGLMFAIAAIPGSILGAFTTPYIPRDIFDLIFGTALIIVAFYLFFQHKNSSNNLHEKNYKFSITCVITDFQGYRYMFSYNPVIGIISSVIVGYLSSLLGIGGGIIHVPVMSQLLNFPVHIATATSHFVLAIMTFTGSITYFVQGILKESYFQIITLSVGVMFGAQLGARYSTYIHGNLIIRCLACALGIVGIRMLFMGFR